MFEEPDPGHPDYSMTEHDLYPFVGPDDEAYSIRREFSESVYEIFDYQHTDVYSPRSVWYSSPDLEEVVVEARHLEEAAVGHTLMEYGHNPDSVGCDMDWRDAADSISDDIDQDFDY